MKITFFDRKKYIESLRKLELRKAPKYVIEAYKEGLVKVVNEYYKQRLKKRLNKEPIKENRISLSFLKDPVYSQDKQFLVEALDSKDLEFIKAFFKMANLDLVSGDRLPPNASKLIKQKMPKNFGLHDLFKKLR